MYDAEIGLEKNDSITLKFAGGSIFIWIEDCGRMSISVSPEPNEDTLQVYLDSETCEVQEVISPCDRIRIPVKTWREHIDPQTDPSPV